jgi:hypothetical protein
VVDLVPCRPCVTTAEPGEHGPSVGIELVGTADLEELRDVHDRAERCRLELLEQLVFAVYVYGCSRVAREPHDDVITAVGPPAPHGVFRSRAVESLQVEVGPLGAFGSQQRANDRFARVGFVIMDFVDHGSDCRP